MSVSTTSTSSGASTPTGCSGAGLCDNPGEDNVSSAGVIEPVVPSGESPAEGSPIVFFLSSLSF